MNKLNAMNNMMPHHRTGSKEKKPTYRLEDGAIINKQTKERIGWYAHKGAPAAGERFCRINGIPVSYRPLDEPAAP